MALLRVVFILIGSSQLFALDVSVSTDPPGPSYKAGSLFSFNCSVVNATWPLSNYGYEYSYGCLFSDVFNGYQTFNGAGRFATTRLYCLDIIRCRITDLINQTVGVGELSIDTVTDIAIQILPHPNFYFITGNISILTANESGRFLDIVCNSGLKQPNLGKWIHPNGNEIGIDNEKYSVERGGGIVSFPYVSLKLKEGYSVGSEDIGLYTCKMLDRNMEERESHIWILPEQNFEPAIPDYFTAYSRHSSVELTCAYSVTPGEIKWYFGSNEITSDAENKINQRLIQSSPTIIYEGVLEMNYINPGVSYCAIHNTIIGNHADPSPSSEKYYENHYFFPGYIGQLKTLTCTFGKSKSIVKTDVYSISNDEYLKSNNSSSLTYNINRIEDINHNSQYSCIGTSMDNQTHYLNLSIVALIPSHSLTMHVISPDVIFAGDYFTIDVIAIKSLGFTYSQTISCTNANGIPLADLEGVIYPENTAVAGSTLHHQVSIVSVGLSFAGVYYCSSFLETPLLMDNITDNISFTVIITIPAPVVNLDNSTSAIVGSIALFNCSATMNNSNIDVAIVPVFTWSMDGVPINSSGRFNIFNTIGISDVGINVTVYYSELQIAPLLKQDESVLACNVQMHAPVLETYINPSKSANSSTSVLVKGSEELNSLLISFSLISNKPCNQWIATQEILDSVTKMIVDIFQDSCHCQFLPSYISEQHFECHHNTQVEYRARVYGTSDTEASELIEHLQQWFDLTTDSVVTNHSTVQLRIDRQCNLRVLESFNESICALGPSNTSSEKSIGHISLTSVLPTSSMVSNIALIASVCGSLACIGLLIVMCCLGIIVFKWKKSEKIKLNKVKQGVELQTTVFPFSTQNLFYDKHHTNFTSRSLPKVPEFQKAEERDYDTFYEEIQNTSETNMDMDGLKSKKYNNDEYI